MGLTEDLLTVLSSVSRAPGVESVLEFGSCFVFCLCQFELVI